MYFIGIDISTAGTRAAVIDLESAQVVATSAHQHRFVEGLPVGHLEQDPTVWIVAVDQAVRKCLASLGDRRALIRGIGVSAASGGMVLIDQADEIVRPAKLAGDVTAEAQHEELNRAFGGPPGWIELVGNRISQSDLVTRLLWLKQNEPHFFQQTVTVMQPLDFINYWLTGVKKMEWGSASQTGLMNVYERKWCDTVTEYIDERLESMMPELGSSEEGLGFLRKEVAQSWGVNQELLVSSGSGQAMMGALSSGCADENVVVANLETSSRLWTVNKEVVIDSRGDVKNWYDATGRGLAFYEQAGAGLAIETLRTHYHWEGAALLEAANAVPAGAGGLMFIPRGSSGEGLLYGMQESNYTPQHVARATIEGVALGLAYGYSRFQEMSIAVGELRVTGAGSGNEMWRQLIADVLGVPVVGLATDAGPALGAAMHAAVSFFRQSGETLTHEEMAAYAVVVDEATWCEPVEARHEFYIDQLSRQQYLIETLVGAGFLE